MRNLFLLSLLAPLVACSPSEQEVAEEVAELPVEIVSLENTNWQLLQVRVLGGYVFAADDPSEYVLNFRSENRLTGSSDCNQLSGTWLQDGLALHFEPFISTRKLCAPGSLHNNLILNLKDTVAMEFRDGQLFLTTPTEGIEMQFESRDQ